MQANAAALTGIGAHQGRADPGRGSRDENGLSREIGDRKHSFRHLSLPWPDIGNYFVAHLSPVQKCPSPAGDQTGSVIFGRLPVDPWPTAIFRLKKPGF
ncbi:hypothetical protein MesoLjLc_32710 [Mesorhizobium sp. L-8-10]|nr:hypothetical protein MesoLjLc_32710 [Mesorhizobium sp. L-8-10]